MQHCWFNFFLFNFVKLLAFFVLGGILCHFVNNFVFSGGPREARPHGITRFESE